MTNNPSAPDFKGHPDNPNAVQEMNTLAWDAEGLPYVTRGDAIEPHLEYDDGSGEWYVNETMLDWVERLIRSAKFMRDPLRNNAIVRVGPAGRKEVLNYYAKFVSLGLNWSLRDGVLCI